MNQTAPQSIAPYVPALPHPWQPFVPSDPESHARKMKAQLIRIVDLCRGSGRPALYAAPSEVREEVALAKRHDDDESIIDVDVEVSVISPELAKAVAPAKRHAREEEGCLNEVERESLARDLLAYRIAQDLLCARDHAPYALIPYQATA